MYLANANTIINKNIEKEGERLLEFEDSKGFLTKMSVKLLSAGRDSNIGFACKLHITIIIEKTKKNSTLNKLIIKTYIQTHNLEGTKPL